MTVPLHVNVLGTEPDGSGHLAGIVFYHIPSLAAGYGSKVR